MNGRLFRRLISFALISSISSIAHAVAPSQNWFMSVGGGMTRLNFADKVNVDNGTQMVPPNNIDYFTVNNPKAGIFQYNLGYQWHDESPYFPYTSFFLQYRHYFRTNITGNVVQFSLPTFNNYQYKMSYEADMLTLNGKFDLINYHHFLPYVSAGLGFIVNHLNDYSESVHPNVTPRIPPSYQGNTKLKGALTLGVGIDYLISQHYGLTLGYDHVFQGIAKSGPGEGLWNQTKLNFGNVKMDTVFINLNIHFPQA